MLVDMEIISRFTGLCPLHVLDKSSVYENGALHLLKIPLLGFASVCVTFEQGGASQFSCQGRVSASPSHQQGFVFG